MAAAATTRFWDDRRPALVSPSRRCSVCGVKYPAEFVVCPKDATPLDAAGSSEDDPLIGEVLAGTFCVTEPLGAGGMGMVYAAEHVRLPRRFAVKVMHETLSHYPEAMDRFEREAQAAARIASPHVVEVVDIVRTKRGLPCLVTELLEGEDLGSLVDRLGKLPLPAAIRISRQICRGLAAAHAAGVVHRDLKPSNVFVVQRSDERIRIKILDFGVAKLTDGQELTRTGRVVGTPAYMAPEQARRSADVDARTDVYAVGAVLYKLLTGSTPFPDEDQAATLQRVLTEDPKRPRELEPRIPPGVELLIQRAMARSPADRPSSARELEHELAAFDERSLVTPTLAVRARTGSGFLARKRHAADASAGPLRSVGLGRRVRTARPFAIGLAITGGLAAGAALFVIAGALVLLVGGRPSLTAMEKILLGAMAGFSALFATVGSLSALASRWRSAWAVDRLARGLRVAILTLFSLTGLMAIGWRAYGLAALPIGSPWLPFIDVSLVALPTMMGATVFLLTLRRARSHS
jgi:serine/threonine-protein kinase